MFYSTSATLRSGYQLPTTVSFAESIEAMMRQSLGVDADELVEPEEEIPEEEEPTEEEDEEDEEEEEDDEEEDVVDSEEPHDEL